MHINDFDFELPRELIALHPCEPRDAARLLVIPAAGGFDDRRISDLPALLHPGDLLVFNDTKVIPARLTGRRGEAVVEVSALPRPRRGFMARFCEGRAALADGRPSGLRRSCCRRGRQKHAEGDVTLRFNLDTAAFREALTRHGSMPLPPYIKRPRGGDPRDRQDYQTIFARTEGAVAAPTAGLHFTASLLEALARRGIGWTTLTLHVGPGTFLPVKVTDPRNHPMHAEWGVVSAETAERIAAVRREGGRIIAVENDQLRLLETAAAENGDVRAFAGDTRLFIIPGYRFRAIDMLLTNFHLARSTLLMLVAALAGSDASNPPTLTPSPAAIGSSRMATPA